ncbi:hypothetical protein R1sor_016157 [Riccia sorocarpa]|uniref:Uncharacterized protein n=1 Tax=Riccia sorocarpa TaxID=122646 RepID=A0ABD3HEL2_9MARC
MAVYLDLLNVDPLIECEAPAMLTSLGSIFKLAGVTDQEDGKFANMHVLHAMNGGNPLTMTTTVAPNQGTGTGEPAQADGFHPVGRRGRPDPPKQRTRTGQASSPSNRFSPLEDLSDNQMQTPIQSPKGEDGKSKSLVDQRACTRSSEEKQCNGTAMEQNLQEARNDVENLPDLNQTPARSAK